MKRILSILLVALPLAALPGCSGPVEEGPPTTRGEEPVAAEPSEPVQSPEPAEEEPAPEPEAEKMSVAELVEAVMKAKNPHFKGEIGIRADAQGIVQVVAVNDPAIEDISALEGLPLLAADLSLCRVKDIGALKGAPLQQLALEDVPITDLSPLKGAPLKTLYLAGTRVTDLGPLKGMPLTDLNIIGTKVSDLSPLEGMSLKMLWLSDCPVSDLSPLAKVGVVSVTAARTKVADLSPLKGHPTLRRLHIAGSEVTDLTPIQRMELTRLIFTPSRIEKGIEHARSSPTINEIDVEFGEPGTRQRPMHPSQFWPLYDAGEFD